MTDPGYYDLWLANNKSYSANINVTKILANSDFYTLSNTNLNVSANDYISNTTMVSSNSNNFASTYSANYNNVRSYVNTLTLEKSYVTITLPNSGGSFTVLSDVNLVIRPPSGGTSPTSFGQNINNAANLYFGSGGSTIGSGTPPTPPPPPLLMLPSSFNVDRFGRNEGDNMLTNISNETIEIYRISTYLNVPGPDFRYFIRVPDKLPWAKAYNGSIRGNGPQLCAFEDRFTLAPKESVRITIQSDTELGVDNPFPKGIRGDGSITVEGLVKSTGASTRVEAPVSFVG